MENSELEQLSEEARARLGKARQRVIESIGKNMDLYGVTLSIGHLYGNMFFRNEPVTLDEMVETMGLSKTSISTGMRTLNDLKMIHKVWGKGVRKDLYKVEPDWYQTFSDFFVIKWRKSIEMNLQSLQKSKREIEALLDEHSDNNELQEILKMDVEKIVNAVEYYDWLDRLIDALESGEIFKLVPKTTNP